MQHDYLIEFFVIAVLNGYFPLRYRNISISGNGIFGPASPVYMSQSLRTFCLSKYFALNGFFRCSCKRGQCALGWRTAETLELVGDRRLWLVSQCGAGKKCWPVDAIRARRRLLCSWRKHLTWEAMGSHLPTVGFSRGRWNCFYQPCPNVCVFKWCHFFK